MYYHRAIEEKFKKALGQFPVCMVTGPRQAGKSTLLRHILKDYRYITLDDLLLRELAQKDPALFLSSYDTPLIIDEIQYAPQLLSIIKMRVDADRKKYGQYVLTGSQTFQMMHGVAETLAGRIAIFHLYPFDWQEINVNNEMVSDAHCLTRMVTGFYPEFFIIPDLDKELWFGSYLSTYIERDVRNLKAISDLGRFQTFMILLASRAGQLLNMSEISKECGISQPTVKDWLSILESTYVIHLLKPYSKNITKRVVKAPKLFFVDTGLLCYLLGIDTPERLLKSSTRGHIFENMVVMEMIKRLSSLGKRSESYFYRSSSGVEVDLLIQLEGKLNAYEIKMTKTLSKDSAHPLKLFMEEHQVVKARVLSLNEAQVMLTPDIEAIQWSQGISL